MGHHRWGTTGGGTIGGGTTGGGTTSGGTTGGGTTIGGTTIGGTTIGGTTCGGTTIGGTTVGSTAVLPECQSMQQNITTRVRPSSIPGATGCNFAECFENKENYTIIVPLGNQWQPEGTYRNIYKNICIGTFI